MPGVDRSATLWPLLWFALALPTAVTLLYFVVLAGQPALIQQTAYSVGKAVQFLLPLACWLWLRPPAIASERRVMMSLAQGCAFGVLVVAAGVLLYLLVLLPSGFFTASLPTIQNKVRAMGLDSPDKFLALVCFYALVHSFLEEYYWRWFVFRYCRLRWSLATSVVVSSLGFMAHHVLVLATLLGWDAPATYLLSAAVAIGGAVWAWLYEKHGTLLGPWLSHLLIDALIFAIGYDLVFRVGA